VTSDDTVTKPTDPTKEGYTFAGWYTDIALTQGYDFSAKVTDSFTLYAGWEEDLGLGTTHNTYISGYGNGIFGPDDNMTRAQAAMIFYNLLEDTYLNGGSFTDVSENAWYYDAVTALSGLGVISGYGDGSFGPDNTITRAEFVTMAIHFTGLDVRDGATGLQDVPESYWAAGYIAAAVDAGYVSGYSDGSFRPESQITRAEAVTILNKIRGCEGISEGVSFTDVPETHWAYTAITAAATKHEHE